MIVPSRAWIAARGGIVVSRASRSPARRPGNTCSGRQAMPGVPSASSSTASASRPEMLAEDPRRERHAEVDLAAVARPAARDVRTRESVAVSAARA